MSGPAAPVPEQDVIAFLATASAGSTWPAGVPALIKATNLFASPELPAVPGGVGVSGQAVFVWPYGGEPPTPYFGDKGSAGSVYYANVQALVRSNPGDAAGGIALARAVRDALPRQEAGISSAGSTTYFFCLAKQSEPNYLGCDNQNRHRWSLNFKLGRRGVP